MAFILLSLLLYFPSSVIASNDPAQPPEGGTVIVNGNWNVTDSREYHNCTIILNDNLFISSTGNLTLTNVTLIVNATMYKEDNRVEVFSGGILTIGDYDGNNMTAGDASVITDSEWDTDNRDSMMDYSFGIIIHPGSYFSLKNSEVHHCYSDSIGKFEIFSDNALIDHCLITDSNIRSGASTVISNNTIRNTDRGIDTIMPIAPGMIYPLILGNHFSNLTIGINAWMPSPIIKNNTFTDNGIGISLPNSFADIRDNLFIDNNVGIDIYGYIGASPPMATIIHNNTFTMCMEYGVRADSPHNVVVEENSIECPNGYAFISTDVGNLTFSNNTIVSGDVVFNQTALSNLWLVDTYATANLCYWPPTTMNVDQDSTLVIKNSIMARVVLEDGTPMEGVDVLVRDNNDTVYASSGYGGVKPQTNFVGYSGEAIVIDRIYYGSNTATENITTIEVKFDGMVFNDNPRSVNMSLVSTTEIFTDSIVPEIETIFPINNTQGVPVTTIISIKFTDKMNTTATENSFSITPITIGTFSWNANNLTFSPTSNLSHSTTYSIKVDGNAKDYSGNLLDGNGNGVAEGSPIDDYSWEFLTKPDTISPKILAVYPSPNSNNVSIMTSIHINFTKPMNNTSVNESFSIMPNTFGTFIWNLNSMRFEPTDNLLPSTNYIITINGSIAEDYFENLLDGNGNGIAEGSPVDDYSWEFTTGMLDTTPPSAIIDMIGMSGTYNGEIDLIWTATGDDGNSGTAASYDIRYSLAMITEANWQNATQVTGEPTPGAPGTAEQMTMSGLQPGETYYFAVKVLDEVPNHSILSNVANAVAKNLAGPATPTGLTATVQEKGIKLQWNVVADSDLSHYAVYRSTDNVTFTLLANVTAGTEEYLDTDIAEETTYYYKLKAVDDEGNESPFSVTASAARTTDPIIETPNDYTVYIILLIIAMLGAVGALMFLRRGRKPETQPETEEKGMNDAENTENMPIEQEQA